MPFLPDSSSTSRRSRGDTLHVGARPRDADGVLVLYVEGGESPPRIAPADPAPEPTVLAQLRAERDAALEEVAYLREQLRSVSEYHTHLLDEERRRMFDERTQLATELASMREDLQRRTFPGALAAWSARAPFTGESGADAIGTR